jgi:hypothetical protein
MLQHDHRITMDNLELTNRVRMQLGSLMIELISAQVQIQVLQQRIAELEKNGAASG